MTLCSSDFHVTWSETEQRLKASSGLQLELCCVTYQTSSPLWNISAALCLHRFLQSQPLHHPNIHQYLFMWAHVVKNRGVHILLIVQCNIARDGKSEKSGIKHGCFLFVLFLAVWIFCSAADVAQLSTLLSVGAINRTACAFVQAQREEHKETHGAWKRYTLQSAVRR